MEVVNPLDLKPEDLHKWYLEATKELKPESYNENAQKPYNELTDEQKFIDEFICEKIKQRIRSACMFYLKYKDKPELLVKERPDKAMIEIDYDTAEDIVKEIHRIIERYGKVEAQATIRLKIIEYNEWLFRLSFKDVLGGVDRRYHLY